MQAFLAEGAKPKRTVQEQLERFARLNAVQFQEMDEQVPTGRVPSLQALSSTPKGGSHSRCENRQTGAGVRSGGEANASSGFTPAGVSSRTRFGRVESGSCPSQNFACSFEPLESSNTGIIASGAVKSFAFATDVTQGKLKAPLGAKRKVPSKKAAV